MPAAVALYSRLLDIHKLNADLMAHFASYALIETDWRDLKVACAALMLVQTRAGQPIHDDDGSVAFYDDDYRRIGEAMVLCYEKKSTRMLTPKAVLRVAELLETPEIAALNRAAGFGDPAAKRAPLGRWKAAAKWLAVREKNLPMLAGPRQGRLQGDDQEPRAQGRLQAEHAGVLRGPRLEAEAGRRRSPRGRPRQRSSS